MKQHLNEELNRLKYLLNFKPGQHMTESQIKKTFLGEQNETSGSDAKTTLDFSGWPDTTVGSVTWNGKQYDVYVSSISSNFLGAYKVEKEIPPTTSTSEIQPEITLPTYNAQSFQPNFVRPNPETIKGLQDNSRKVADSIVKIKELSEKHDPQNTLKNIMDFIGNGIQIIAHADGSVPAAKRLSQTDHANYGGKLYGGKTTPFDKNSWLAESRGKASFQIFKANLQSALSSIFDNPKIIEQIIKKIDLVENGGLSTLKVVNHLTPDGKQNPSEIGPEFRRMEFIPKFNVGVPLIIKKVTPARKETEIVAGTKTGEIKLPTIFGGESQIPAFQGQDEAFGGSMWYGVTDEVIKQYNIPVISEGKFNGKESVSLEITNENVLMDSLDFGRLQQNPGAKQNWASTGHLCVVGAGGKKIKRTIDGVEKTFTQVTFYRVALVYKP